MAYDSVEALMAALPELAKAAQAKLRAQDGLFALKLPDRQYFIRLQGGAVTVATVCSDTPDCTIQAAEQQVLDLMNGRLNPMKALLLGKVRVQGDIKPLLRLCALV